MVGQLFVPPDFAAALGTFVNPDTQAIASQVVFPSGEQGAWNPDTRKGIFGAQTDGGAGADITEINLWSESGAIYHTNTSLIVPLHSNYAPFAFRGTTFYVGQLDNDGNPMTVATISDAGVVGGMTWELDAASFSATSMDVSYDETILYYGRGTGLQAAIKRWDLTNDLPLSNLFNGSAGQIMGADIRVVSDGTIVFLLRTSGNTWEGRRYSAGGVLLTTFAVGLSFDGSTSPPRMCLEDDHLSLWVMSFPTADLRTSRFQKFTILTAALESAFDLPNFDPSGTPFRDDNTGALSQSCPVFFLSDEEAPGAEGIIGPLAWVEWPRFVAFEQVESDDPDPPAPPPSPPNEPPEDVPDPPVSPGSPPPTIEGTYGPQTEAMPGGAVVIAAGADIQAVINANPAGTIYWLSAGRYANQTITPKNNDQIWGEYGAYMTGARTLGTWFYDGQNYYATGQSQEGTIHGQCSLGFERCNRVHDVFYDDAPLRAVSTLGALGPGKFFFDYDADRIYIRDTPAGHTVEVGLTTQAIIGSATNVLIRNLVVQKYAMAAQSGAIQPTGANWTVHRCELKYHHGCGLRTAAGMTLTRNRFINNGQMGLGGSSSDGLLVQENEIAYNNYAGHDPGWEAGGFKIVETDGVSFISNWVHHNAGPGMWTDINCINVLYEGNLSEDNDRYGIFHEISYACVIRFNTCRRNGPNSYAGNPYATYWGIMVAASPDTEVYGNTCEDNGGGICAMQQNRSSDPATYGPHEIENLDVHENRVIVSANQLASAFIQDVGDTTYFTSRNNQFEQNIYEGGFCAVAVWHWQNATRTFTAWQGFGNDDTGSCS